MSNTGNDQFDLKVVKARRIIEFLQDDLNWLMQDQRSIDQFFGFNKTKMISLRKDLTFLMSFLERVQENSVGDHPIVAGLLNEITSLVDQLLDGVYSYIHYRYGTIKNDGIFGYFYFRFLKEVYVLRLASGSFLICIFRNLAEFSGMGILQYSRIRTAFHLLASFYLFIFFFKCIDRNLIQYAGTVFLHYSRKFLQNAGMGFLQSFINFPQNSGYYLLHALLFITLQFFFILFPLVFNSVMPFHQYYRKIGPLLKKIKSVKQKVLVTFNGNDAPDKAGKPSVKISLIHNPSSFIKEKIVVGLHEEARELLHKLIGGRKQLEVICITGMGGIGKTTLARRLYDDPAVVNHFHLRAWTSVSQFCEKRELFSNILSSILNESDPIFSMSDEHMGEKLYKCLKGNRYLIVVDDIWDIEVWNEIKVCFPEDDNCSRILMTTRNEDVASKVRISSSPPHRLRFLTRDESWDLFKQKVFPDKSFPAELVEIGNQIVADCKGLPLAIVVIGGLLVKEVKTQEWWRQVAQNIGSAISNGPENIMDILALSYEHLPSSLKSCFLYAGSFPEDYEIPVKRLIRSWIAEGFIQHTDEQQLEDVLPEEGKKNKKLEDTAEDHLIDLISRSLLIAAKKRPDGGIKSCRMHDLLRDLCHRRGKEKKFLQPICKCRQNDAHSLRTFSDCQYFHFHNSHFVNQGKVFNKDTLPVYKLLKTLDMRHINLKSFPEMVARLLHLKYLALRVDRIEKLPPSIFELWRLETFILDGDKGGRVTLTTDILKMVNLRHFQISQELVLHQFWRALSPILGKLQTISQLCPLNSVENLLASTPNLRKLGFHFTLSERNESFTFPNLSGLNQLEALKFEYQILGMMPLSIPHPKMFPPSLKKMTLIGSHLNWKEMAIIGELPNLEVLKIKDNFFRGPLWETSDDGFCSLKFLKLSHLDLQNWISSSSHFPRLEWLVINGCLDLEVIPFEMGEIPTLQKIEVYKSSESAVESARQIQESQRCFGNDDFKVFIYQHFQEYS
ncbi:putative late blight resistance protein homolog R1A-3 [Coffea arabica]|uniref:Late blight resistance protein homolog R1A-3 n=1 Tax=Coffea arabica TaxID=13443 RepID=A0A6P6V826_COFAR|nr:putative late blight resistance protein homolog R1A-10 [Coffea arabica]